MAEKKKGVFQFRPRYATDKFETGLMSEYLNIFQALRYKPISLLEIGVAQGGSIRFFEDYFEHPKTKIVGIDHQKPLVDTKFNDKTIFEVGSQNDAAFLDNIGKKHGKFDVIIDDGAHTFKETKTTYQSLYKHVRPGGYCIIEDWGAELLGPKYAGMIDLTMNICKRHVANGSEVTLKKGYRFFYLCIRKKFK